MPCPRACYPLSARRGLAAAGVFSLLASSNPGWATLPNSPRPSLFPGTSAKINSFSSHPSALIPKECLDNSFPMSKFYTSRQDAGSDLRSAMAVFLQAVLQRPSGWHNSRRISTCERCRCERPARTRQFLRSAFQEPTVTQPNHSAGVAVRGYSCAPRSKLPEWRKLPSAAPPRETSPHLAVSNGTGADLGSGNALALSQSHS